MRLLLTVCLLFLLPLPAGAKEMKFPAPRGAVNDFAQVIPAEYERRMSDLARLVWERAGVALVVATFPDLGGEPIEEFANRLYEAWGIGKKGEDKGLLILLAMKERRIRVETGYGVEGILPDAKVGAIMDRYIIPYLRRGRIGEGLYSGLLAFAQVVAEEEGVELKGAPAPLPRRRTTPALFFPIFFPLLFFLLFFFSLGARRRALRRRALPFLIIGPYFGGGFGGGFGGFGGGFGSFGGFGGGLSGGGGATRGF